MRSYKIEAVVVRRRNFAEKDRILTLFSRERGKVEARACGARRPGSRLSYASDLGTVAKFHLHEAKFLDIITEVHPIYLPEGARGHFDKTERLGFTFKLIDRLFEVDVPHRKTYEVLKRAVESVSERDDQLLFLAFLLNLLSDLGVKPETQSCTICHKRAKANEKLGFSPKSGLVHLSCLPEAAPLDPNELKLIRLILQYPFEHISRAKIDRKVFKRVYRQIIIYIEWHFGKILPEKVL